jgi:hypothetical protein
MAGVAEKWRDVAWLLANLRHARRKLRSLQKSFSGRLCPECARVVAPRRISGRLEHHSSPAVGSAHPGAAPAPARAHKPKGANPDLETVDVLAREGQAERTSPRMGKSRGKASPGRVRAPCRPAYGFLSPIADRLTASLARGAVRPRTAVVLEPFAGRQALEERLPRRRGFSIQTSSSRFSLRRCTAGLCSVPP